jgi:predicted transcriptional regulator
MGPRKYRTRLEVLHDFLGAVRETGKKTHIIGLSNLNPASFQSYLDFCHALQLVEDTPAGYRLTPRAEAVLEVIQRLLTQSVILDAALLDLHRDFNGSNPSQPPTQGALRYVSSLAWNEVLRSASGSLELETEPFDGHHSIDPPTPKVPAWLDRAGASEPEGSVVALQLLPGAAPSPRPRPGRTRPRE